MMNSKWILRGALLLVMGAALIFFRWQSGVIQGQAAQIGEMRAAKLGLAANIEALRAEQARVDKIMEDWNRDRQTLAQSREATRNAVREALAYHDFQAWFDAALPRPLLPSGGLLGAQHPSGAGTHQADPAVNPDARNSNAGLAW